MTNWTGFTDFVGTPDVTTHTGFLLAEDAAVKNYLTGLTVPTRTGTDPVGVWFRWPEGERRKKFPFITIDLLDIQPSYDRWTSLYYMDTQSAVSFEDPISGEQIRTGLYQPSVSPQVGDPSGYDADVHNIVVPNYLMYTLLYQVSVCCRSELHDRFLQSRFRTDIFPPRPFWIGVDADHTWRRAELLDVAQADLNETDESGSKKILRRIYTLSIDAEIPQDVVSKIEKVLRVHIDLYRENPITHRETADHSYSIDHQVADPINVVPPQ